MRRRYWYTEWHNPVRNCIWGSVRGFWSSNELAVLHCNLVYKCRINLFACETVLRVPVLKLSDELSFIQKSCHYFFFHECHWFHQWCRWNSTNTGILITMHWSLKWLIYFTLHYLHALRSNSWIGIYLVVTIKIES